MTNKTLIFPPMLSIKVGLVEEQLRHRICLSFCRFVASNLLTRCDIIFVFNIKKRTVLLIFILMGGTKTFVQCPQQT